MNMSVKNARKFKECLISLKFGKYSYVFIYFKTINGLLSIWHEITNFGFNLIRLVNVRSNYRNFENNNIIQLQLIVGLQQNTVCFII